jgi:hypothetical protein
MKKEETKAWRHGGIEAWREGEFVKQASEAQIEDR